MYSKEVGFRQINRVAGSILFGRQLYAYFTLNPENSRITRKCAICCEEMYRESK